MDFKLLIFDCDGVLVDSEGITARVFAEEVRQNGFDLPVELFRRELAGGNLRKSIAYVEEQIGHKLPENFEESYRKKSFEAFANEIQAVEGVESIIQRLDRPYCLASNAPRAKVELNLRTTGLMPYFEDRIFSAYELKIWKPDPAFYLTVARTMGYAPEDCIVIEDSKFGVRAAHQAGIRVFGYTDGIDYKIKELEAEGAIIVDTMKELEAKLWP